MDDQENAKGLLRCPIYQPLDPTKREIRVLELNQGAGDALVEGQLVITSIPLPKLGSDAFWDVEDELKRTKIYVGELELEKLRLIDKLIRGLIREQKSLLQKCDSLKSQVGKMNQQSLMAQQKDIDLRLKQLATKFERHRQMRLEIEQKIKEGKPIAADSEGSSIKKPNILLPSRVITSGSAQYDESHTVNTENTASYCEQPTRVQYEAVSYCWNNEQPSTKVYLNGLSFEAPSTAVEVLRNLRFADHTRTLWIDALCINQQDPEERAQQVAMMGDVYRNSSTTLIWLGPSDDNIRTRSAVKFCSAVAQQILQGQDISKLSDLETVASICQKIGIPRENTPEILDIIFMRRWFTRLWVWQEAALSPVSICYIASFTIPWQDIMLTAFWWIEAADQYTSLPEESIPTEATELNMHFPSTVFMIGVKHEPDEYTRDTHLSEIIRQSRHCNATDGRDKIFGLLGMTRWSKSGRPFPPGIVPNYQMSKRNCIRNATRVMLQEDGDLDALSDDLLDVERGPGSEYETWPSWTPIWCETSDISGPLWLDASYRTHNGQMLSVDTFTKCADPDVLLLHGYQVDVIETTIPMTKEVFADFETVPTNFLSLHKTAEKSAVISMKTLLLTILADRYQDEKISEDNPIIQTCMDHLSESPHTYPSSSLEQSVDIRSSDKTKDKARAELKTVRASLQSTGVGRRLFVTTSGRIGIGPGDLKDQDIAVVLFGGTWPFILRRQNEHYTLIGHSFIRGIMNGEFVIEMEAPGVPAQSFEIH